MRNPEGWVIDASVALKWYLRDEDFLQQADGLHQAVRADPALGHAPHISRYEVANGLSVAFRMGRIPTDSVPRDIQNFFNSGLANDSDPDWLLLDAAGISMEFPVFLNDAVYMALARSLAVDFVTSDRILYDKVANDFSFVRWLGDIPVS
jgi:predicted nucleic acid-binding protein